jgi:hypothetical protein
VLVTPASVAAFSFEMTVTSTDEYNGSFVVLVGGNGVLPPQPPTIQRAGGSWFSGPVGGPFNLTVGPGVTLSNATLQLVDADLDPIDLNSVGVTTAIAGVNTPAPAADLASGTVIAFTGVAEAYNDSGNYAYTINIDDDVFGLVQVVVNITIVNMKPTHAPVAGVTGSGVPGARYARTLGTGTTADLPMCDIIDANTSQTHSVTSVTLMEKPASSTMVWNFQVIGGKLYATPIVAPESNDIGVHVYNVRVTDSGSEPQFDDIALALHVIQGIPAQITSEPAGKIAVGTPYSYTIEVVGAPEPEISVSGLPAWLSYNAATHTIHGTPAAADVGRTGVITVTASNLVGLDATQMFTIKVLEHGDSNAKDEEGGCAASGAQNTPWLLLVGLLALGAAVARGGRRLRS